MAGQWLSTQASQLTTYLQKSVLGPTVGWIKERWGQVSAWLADQIPALGACWSAFAQFAKAARAKIARVPLLGAYVEANIQAWEGALLGALIEHPTGMQMFGQLVAGFVPGLGEAAALRDGLVVLWRYGEGKASGPEALLGVVGALPGLSALRGGHAGKELLDNADVLAKALKELEAAGHSVPPGLGKLLADSPELVAALETNPELVATLAKNPQVLTALAKNPGLLADALQYGDQGLEALARGGEDGMAALKGAGLAPDEMARVIHPAADGAEAGNNIFQSYGEGRDWFLQNHADPGSALGQLPGPTGYGLRVDFTGADRDVIAQSMETLNGLIERHPGAVERLQEVNVVGANAKYPTYLGGKPFDAYASALPSEDSKHTIALWLNEHIFRDGHLPSQMEIGLQSGRSVAMPTQGSSVINFQALISHEYGHAVHRWLDGQSSDIKNKIASKLENIMTQHRDILQQLTPSSYGRNYTPSQQPREIFAELFASREVINSMGATDLIDQSLVHPLLRNKETQDIVLSFCSTIDNIVQVLPN